MNVFVVNMGQDTGGQGVRIVQAFARHAPGWNVRAMHSTDNYIKYPRDLRWDAKEAARLYNEADVVHHRNRLVAYSMFDNGQHKPAVIHHHGTRLRRNSAIVTKESKSIRAVDLVSTVDLLLSAPGAEWCPSPFNLEELAGWRRPKPNRVLRIAHAPTNRAIKGTTELLAALNRLAKSHTFEFDLIEQVEWRVCLSRKGRADIFVDQMILGYGNNAVEAWAMGLPVVAGVQDPAVRARMIEEWGELPFYEVTPETLETGLAALMESKELRDEWGARGLAHVRKYHDEAVVVEQLKRIYANAPKTRGSLWLNDSKKELVA